MEDCEIRPIIPPGCGCSTPGPFRPPEYHPPKPCPPVPCPPGPPVPCTPPWEPDKAAGSYHQNLCSECPPPVPFPPKDKCPTPYRPPAPASRPLPPGWTRHKPPLGAGPHGVRKLLEYWCTSVIPFVFSPNVTLYESLCHLAQELQQAIGQIDANTQDITELDGEICNIYQWINDFTKGDFSGIQEYIEKYIKNAVFFGLTDSGYFCAYIPDGWDGIQFGTTGFDEPYCCDGVYGRLTLSY